MSSLLQTLHFLYHPSLKMPQNVEKCIFVNISNFSSCSYTPLPIKMSPLSRLVRSQISNKEPIVFPKGFITILFKQHSQIFLHNQNKKD